MLLPLLLNSAYNLQMVVSGLLPRNHMIMLLLAKNLFLLNLIHNQVLHIHMMLLQLSFPLHPTQSSTQFRQLFPLQRSRQILMSLMRQLLMLTIWRKYWIVCGSVLVNLHLLTLSYWLLYFGFVYGLDLGLTLLCTTCDVLWAYNRNLSRLLAWLMRTLRNDFLSLNWCQELIASTLFVALAIASVMLRLIECLLLWRLLSLRGPVQLFIDHIQTILVLCLLLPELFVHFHIILKVWLTLIQLIKHKSPINHVICHQISMGLCPVHLLLPLEQVVIPVQVLRFERWVAVNFWVRAVRYVLITVSWLRISVLFVSCIRADRQMLRNDRLECCLLILLSALRFLGFRIWAHHLWARNVFVLRWRYFLAIWMLLKWLIDKFIRAA